MSEVNYYKGYIIKIKEVEGLSFNDGIDKLRTLGYDISEFRVDYAEEWIYYDTKILWINKTFYHMERIEVNPDDNILIAEPIKDGYKFELKYYSSGDDFEKVLETAITNIK